MNSSPERSDEQENKRVRELISYDLIDAPPDIELDEITKLAYTLCETPISLISLVDHSRLWFKSNHGLEATQTAKNISFCQYTILQQDLFIVEDCLLDDRFKSNPLVIGDQLIRFYAGTPLVSPEGYNIGTLCIIDKKPRILTETQKFVLKALAKQVITSFELRKRNKEFFNLNEKAEKLSKTKEVFFSNMSHELRTPLNAISGFTENLSKTKLDTEQKEQIGIIKSSVDILISIVNDILDYSKIDTGTLKIEKHSFNLRALVKTIYEMMNFKAHEKNLLFIAHFNKEIPSYINGDKIKLNQILINLIGNAIKFTNKGIVTLSIDILNNLKEEIELNFSVKDTGIGIPCDKLGEIFDRFQQVEGTTRVYGGSGLGLSITKSLVEMHNGKLHVKSELNEGSEFSFSIKYEKSAQEELLLLEDKSNRWSSKPSFNNVRVLLAEDNVINVKLIKKLFKGTGIHLETSENGKVCVEKLKKDSYDIVLMDLFMPEMDGYETTRYIRNTLKLDIPIIGLSANISQTDRNRSFELGMNEYITKPFKIDELLKTISRFSKNNASKIKYTRNISKSIQENKTINFNKKIDPKYLALMLSKEKIFNLKLKQLNIQKNEYSEFKPSTKINLFNTLENTDSHGILNQQMNKDSLKTEKLSQRINLKILQENSGNDEEFEKELIDVFLYEIPKYFKELEDVIHKEDFDAIKKAAHKIKSPLGIFGLSVLKNQLEKIEEFSEILQLMPIVTLYENCQNSLKGILSELKLLRQSVYCKF